MDAGGRTRRNGRGIQYPSVEGAGRRAWLRPHDSNATRERALDGAILSASRELKQRARGMGERRRVRAVRRLTS